MTRQIGNIVVGGGVAPAVTEQIGQERQMSENRLLQAMQQQAEAARTSATLGTQQRGQDIQAQRQAQSQALQSQAMAEAQDKELAAKEAGRRADNEFMANQNALARKQANDLEQLRRSYQEADRTGDVALFREFNDKADATAALNRRYAMVNSANTLKTIHNMAMATIKSDADREKYYTSLWNMSETGKHDKAAGDLTQAGAEASATSVLPDAMKSGAGIVGVLGVSLADARLSDKGITAEMLTGPDAKATLAKLKADGQITDLDIGRAYRVLDGIGKVVTNRISQLSGETQEVDKAAEYRQKLDEEDAGQPFLKRLWHSTENNVYGYPEGARGKDVQKTPAGREYQDLMAAKAKLANLSATLDSMGYDDPKIREAKGRVYGTGVGGTVNSIFGEVGKDNFQGFLDTMNQYPLSPATYNFPAGIEQGLPAGALPMLEADKQWFQQMQSGGMMPQQTGGI